MAKKPIRVFDVEENEGLEQLAEDVSLLMKDLTQDQAEEMTYMFPHTEQSVFLMDSYLATPNKERETQFGSISSYLKLLTEVTELFPVSSDAFKVMENYLAVPPEERLEVYGTLESYLEDLRTAKLGSEERMGLHSSEAESLKSKVTDAQLVKPDDRDNPLEYGHRREHDLTRGLEAAEEHKVPEGARYD